MSVLLLLIPISLALSSLAVIVCLIAIRSGQFDDLENSRWRAVWELDGKFRQKVQEILKRKDGL